MASNFWLGHKIRNFVCIQILAESFAIFRKVFGWILSGKKFRQNSELCKGYRVQNALKWRKSLGLRNWLSNVYKRGFWCKFWLQANFSRRFIAKNCQNIGQLETFSKFQRLFITLNKQRKWNGLHDAHWFALRSSRELFELRPVVYGWSGQCTC